MENKTLKDVPPLGYVVDEDDAENESQEELNAINLYVYDQHNFLELLKYRLSRYVVNDYLEEFDEEDVSIWERMLRVLVRHYSLNNLKMYQTEIKISNFQGHISELIKDLKIKIHDDINEGKIKRDMTLEQMDNFLQNNEYHLFLKWSIRYLDKFSFKRFMKKIFEENKLPYANVEDLEED